MNNCIILGSGRSGTSMVAGALSRTGYFMGDHMYPANPTNPKGMFEDGIINGCNEEILTQILPEQQAESPTDMRHPRYGQRWLSLIHPHEQPTATPATIATIKQLTDRQPFCFKDPRFSYTLAAWRPYLNNTVFLCVFRDPASTILSILRQITKVQHLQGFRMNADDAYAVWTAMYSRILTEHRATGKWLFIHYEQAFTNSGLCGIGDFTGARIDTFFPERSLRNAFPDASLSVPAAAHAVYGELCKCADFTPEPEP